MPTSRIDACFTAKKREGRTVLVGFLVVGDPSVEDTTACALAALRAGADVLELGVPFSDPTADGPVIAAAAYRAIQRGGSLRAALEVARRVRAESDAPLVLFTYYNPIVAFGIDALPKAAAEAGIDGLLVVDLPPEEGAEVRAGAKRENLSMIPLIAPTTGREREPKVLNGASGFAYYVSVTGVTGTKAAPLGDAGRDAAALRGRAGIPVVVGFGVRTPEQAREVASAGVDGVVVGTEIVRVISDAPDPRAREAAVGELIGRLRKGLDSATS